MTDCCFAGANYVGHFLLIHLLLERLAASTRSRIVLLSSIQEELGWIPWDDPLALHAPSGSDYYAPSKLASLMLGLELARRLEGTGIDVFVAHPGIAQTDLFRKMTRRNFSAIMLDWLQSLFGQSAYRGGLPVAYAATEPSLQGKGGMFIGPRYLAQLCMQAFAFASLRPHNRDARSEHARYRLYEQTADALEEFLHVQLPNRLKGVPETKVRAGMKSPGSKAAAHEE